MSEQFHLRFGDADAATDAYGRLNGSTVQGRPAFHSTRNGNSILTGCGVFEELPPDAVLICGDRKTAFNSVCYIVDLKKSGMHPTATGWCDSHA